jgi:1-deoxy-D-xylulose-5-phosphate synthase
MVFNWNKLFRQAVAVLLCAVMILPMLLVAPAEEMTASAASYTPAHAAGILSKYAYSGGMGSTLLTYDCGNGVTNNGTKSCIRIIRNTTVSEFNAYCSLLAADHTLTYAKDINEPVLLHVKTVKGKGYAPAERNPDAFHGVSPFDPTVGEAKKGSGKNFSAVFGDKLTALAQEDGRVCAITAAMVSGTGLDGFAAAHPKRFYDVGIAEGCAVSMAAGMAKQGAIPVFAVYSTFLQRAYDMLIHDVAIDKLHVVFGVDRAGLVGEDGETHQGVFDVAFLDSVPGMRVLAPSSYAEMESMLERAVLRMDGPVAVRYPRGGEGTYRADSGEAPAVSLRSGKDLTMVGYGVEINELLAAAEGLAREGIEAEVIKLNELTPLPTELVLESVRRTGVLLVAEDSIASAGVGQRLAAAVEVNGICAKIALINCGDRFVHHGAVSCLKAELGLDAQGIMKTAREVLHRG